jgi:transposase
LEGRVIEKAYKEGKWEDLGRLGNGKKACTYKGQEFIEKVEGHEIRLVVLQSSAGKERLEGKKAKLQKELKAQVNSVNEKTFACEADAVKEWERFQKSHKNCIYSCSVEYMEIRKEKKKRGKPAKKPKPPVVEIKWGINIKITGENEAAMSRFEHAEESFVLITNVNSHECNLREILGYYKDQMVVETEFRIFKEPCVASSCKSFGTV